MEQATKASPEAIVDLIIDHRQVIESSLDGYLRVSRAGLVLDVNAAYCQASGYHREELVGMQVSKLTALPTVAQTNIERVMQLGGLRFESVHRRKNGALWDVQVSAVFIDVNGGEMYGFLRDITESRRAAMELDAKERHFAALVAATPVGVFETDAAGACIFVNQRWSAITGLTFAEAAGNEWALSLHPQDRECVAAEWAASVSENRLFKLEYRFIAKSGRVVWVLGQSGKLVSPTGETSGFIGTITDITSQKSMEEQVRQLAFEDALTQLPNRRLLCDRLKQALSASKRSGSFGALMFLDLDNFKSLNDLQGHYVGDVLLIETAKRLIDCVREVDTVARFGGDEFVVLLSELSTDMSNAHLRAQNVAEKIRGAVGRPYQLKVLREGQVDANIEHQCTVSIGVVMFAQTDISPDDALKWADGAMYEAKKAGRNTVRFHSSSHF